MPLPFDIIFLEHYFNRPFSFQSYSVKHEHSRVLSTEELLKRLGPDEAQELIPFDTSLVLFLSPESVIHQTEVLAFDFYDLIGNIGGFLGLFLGASILSMWDIVTSRAKKMCIMI